MNNFTHIKKYAFTGCLFGLLVLSSLQIHATTCADAILVSSFPVINQAIVCGTSNDIGTGTPPSCGFANYRSGKEALYYFVAPASDLYVISISGQTFTGIYLYQGCPGQVGTTCITATTGSATSKEVAAFLTTGNTYYVLFDTWAPTPDSPCPGTFTIFLDSWPDNEICAGATNLTPTAGIYTNPGVQSSVNAHSSGITIPTCSNATSTSALDVWYSFTTGATGGVFNVVVVGSGGFDPVVQGFSGTCGTLSSLGCIDASFQNGTETLVLTGLAASTTYYLRVYGYNGGTGSFTISLTGPIPAPTCSTPITPTNAATGVYTRQRLFWAASSGATSYDVYFGTAPNPPLVANVTVTNYNPGTFTGGTTYYWKIVPKSVSGSATGCSVWTFSTISCPGGLGTGVHNITLPYTATGLSTCGNNEDVNTINAAAVCGNTLYYTGEDVVYIFTPTSTASYVIALTTGTDNDAGIMLYQGCPVAGGTCVGFSQSTTGLTRSITAALTSGATYYLVVGNYGPPCIATYSLNIALASALPLELASFAGKTESRSNMLRWETLTEKNVQWHIVERSVDGIKWMEVGRKPGQLDAQSPVKYELEDRVPLAKAYYRLRSVDYAGAENLSSIIVLTRKGEHFGITAAFPSPTMDQVTVQFASLKEEDVTIQVMDISGRLVLVQEYAADNGINEAVLQLDGLQAGVYLVRISNTTATAEPMRIVKE